jgi:hypothetical protein
MLTILQVAEKKHFRSYYKITKEMASKRSIMEKLLFFKGEQANILLKVRKSAKSWVYSALADTQIS